MWFFGKKDSQLKDPKHQLTIELNKLLFVDKYKSFDKEQFYQLLNKMYQHILDNSKEKYLAADNITDEFYNFASQRVIQNNLQKVGCKIAAQKLCQYCAELCGSVEKITSNEEECNRLLSLTHAINGLGVALFPKNYMAELYKTSIPDHLDDLTLKCVQKALGIKEKNKGKKSIFPYSPSSDFTSFDNITSFKPRFDSIVKDTNEWYMSRSNNKKDLNVLNSVIPKPSR